MVEHCGSNTGEPHGRALHCTFLALPLHCHSLYSFYHSLCHSLSPPLHSLYPTSLHPSPIQSHLLVAVVNQRPLQFSTQLSSGSLATQVNFPSSQREQFSFSVDWKSREWCCVVCVQTCAPCVGVWGCGGVCIHGGGGGCGCVDYVCRSDHVYMMCIHAYHTHVHIPWCTQQSPHAHIPQCTQQSPHVHIPWFTQRSPHAHVPWCTHRSPHAHIPQCTQRSPHAHIPQCTQRSPHAHIPQCTQRSPHAVSFLPFSYLPVTPANSYQLPEQQLMSESVPLPGGTGWMLRGSRKTPPREAHLQSLVHAGREVIVTSFTTT